MINGGGGSGAVAVRAEMCRTLPKAGAGLPHSKCGRLLCRREELKKGGGGIGGEHEVFTDEKGVEAGGAQITKIGVSAKTGFGDGDAVIGNLLDELEGSLYTHGQRLQVAIVDADDAGSLRRGRDRVRRWV